MTKENILPIEKEEKNIESAPKPAASLAADASPAQPATPPQTQATKPQVDPKKSGNLAFNAYNFLGLHWVGNSSLSLWITYNVMTRPGVAENMHKLANALKPVTQAYYSAKSALGIGKPLPKIEQAMKVTKLARSWTEVACMCIAGSIILLPVKWSEDHRQGFVDFFDNLLNPGKKKKRAAEEAEAKKNGVTLPPIQDVPCHKETWTNLIRARLLALVPIFGIDIAMENWNLGRHTAHKGNFDTWEWGMGKHAYENMRPGWREKLVNFFSGKGIKLSGVQYMMRDHLLNFLGSPQELKDISKEMGEIQHHAAYYPKETTKIAQGAVRLAELEGQIVSKGLLKSAEKAIFTEQARMLSKEVSLTLIYTGFLFLLGKTPIVPWAMRKLGISKKTEHAIEDAIETDVGLDVLPFNNPENRGNGHAAVSPAPAVAPDAKTAPDEGRHAAAIKKESPLERIAPKTRPSSTPPETLHSKKPGISADTRQWERAPA